MYDYNMDPDLTIGSMTIRSILSNKDLLAHPMKAACTDKDKDYNDAYTDASAAFLGPNIWDKTLSEFKMDYLDLDALLSGSDEGHPKIVNCNELSTNEKVPHHHNHPHHNHPHQHHHQQQHHQHQQQHHHQHHHQQHQQHQQQHQQHQQQHQQQQHQQQQHQQQQQQQQQHNNNISAQDAPNLVPVQSSRLMSSQPSSPIDSSSLTEIPNNRERRVYSIDCKFSPTDLALATPPGQDHYDPASTTFPDEELKPQPIIKKSRKNFVPDNLKDDKYWARRHKNNIAAKRSREARRLKENQIVLRASYLEKENNSLKEDVMRLKAENDMLKTQLKEFQT